MRALIVDNDISKVKAICEALRSRFWSPTVWMARTSQEAVKLLSRLKDTYLDLVFLEHDLESSDDASNGQTVATAMCEVGVKAKEVMIHTANASGAEAMRNILSPHYQVQRIPFPEVLKVILDVTPGNSRVSAPTG